MEALNRELDERQALNSRLRDPDRVERDIDGTVLLHDGGGVAFDRLLVQPVNAVCLGCPAAPGDIPRHRVQRRWIAAGQEHPRSFAREGPGQSATPERSPRRSRRRARSAAHP